jgi:hypothetical protein
MIKSTHACVFCRAPSSGGNREHLLPASLGGTDKEVLPEGLVCSPCNQYFGTKVERYALDCFPLNILRVMHAVQTKKGKRSRIGTNRGTLSSSGRQGILEYEPTPMLPASAVLGNKHIYVSTHPKYPRELCRLLVKTGLELIASVDLESALSTRYDTARRIARQPVSGSVWSYAVVHRDPAKEAPEARVQVCMEIAEGGGYFVLRYHSVVLVTPMEPHDFDASSGEDEPEVQMHQVHF